jgi:MtN3 and saliva related transmembrane protein
MDYIIVIGLLAGFLTTASFLPQVIKTWKTKSTKDISFYMFSILTVGIFLWMIYGFLINSLPVILANAVSLILSAIIMAFKIKYK